MGIAITSFLSVEASKDCISRVYALKLTLNEINKLRLNWQLVSKVIILSLMSLCWKDGCMGVLQGVAGGLFHHGRHGLLSRFFKRT